MKGPRRLRRCPPGAAAGAHAGRGRRARPPRGGTIGDRLLPTPMNRRRPRLAPATLSEADGVRYLHLGTPWVQGALRLRKPDAIELEYVQRMLAALLLRPEAADPAAEAWAEVRAVQLGLGAATLTRFCHGLGMPTTAVEINPSVIQAGRLWFRLPPDGPRLQVIEADAAAHVADARQAASADLLCVDLYDHEAASPVLDSPAFYRDCARLLAPGGVMAVNLFGRDAAFEHSAARIAAAFAGQPVRTLRPTREGNTIVVAVRLPAWPEAAVLAARAEALEARTGLPARKWLRMWRQAPGAAAGEAAAAPASPAPANARRRKPAEVDDDAGSLRPARSGPAA
ncbi:spermidine synthase-like protein [Piscinibacter sakaiensis]|uniref:Spermidine synthase-like protein n=2 Tax=Piscinibacter sakaiensis TaxID=1547922 RepID=A0A0K8NZ57_PISS1|nr:spermidine synthase-like protein [Piscinibacter sakaiensis]